jgi:hypothetical protein
MSNSYHISTLYCVLLLTASANHQLADLTLLWDVLGTHRLSANHHTVCYSSANAPAVRTRQELRAFTAATCTASGRQHVGALCVCRQATLPQEKELLCLHNLVQCDALQGACHSGDGVCTTSVYRPSTQQSSPHVLNPDTTTATADDSRPDLSFALHTTTTTDNTRCMRMNVSSSNNKQNES